MTGGVRTLGVADRKRLAAAARLVCAARCCLARRLGTQFMLVVVVQKYKY